MGLFVCSLKEGSVRLFLYARVCVYLCLCVCVLMCERFWVLVCMCVVVFFNYCVCGVARFHSFFAIVCVYVRELV